MQKLNINDIIPLNAFAQSHPIQIEVVYALKGHEDNHFPNLYAPEAKILWAHRDIAAVTLRAAQICQSLYGWSCLKIYDCLRPVEAQEAMEEFGYDASLVSLPGFGAHPRAMAIDIEPLDAGGVPVNMGTRFDEFAADPEKDNPAARHYTKFSNDIALNQEIWTNRHKLEFAMRQAATLLGREILPLPQEWWDFREEKQVWEQWAPLREADLHPFQRLINVDAPAIEKIWAGNYPPEISAALAEVSALVAKPIS